MKEHPMIATESDLVSMLRARAGETTQKALARELNITPQYLNDILNERRGISDVVAKALGFKRVVSFEKTGDPAPVTEVAR